MGSMNFPTFVKRLLYLPVVKHTRLKCIQRSLRVGVTRLRSGERVCITSGQLFALVSVIVIRIYYRAPRYCTIASARITATNALNAQLVPPSLRTSIHEPRRLNP